MISIKTIRRKIATFRELCESRAEISSGFQRLELSLEDVDMMQMLQNGSGRERMYWGNRDCSEIVIGFGIADCVEGDDNESLADILNTMQSRIDSADDNLRYYGGAAFDSSFALSEGWNAFGKALFVVPVIEIIQRNGSYLLAYNFSFGDHGYVDSLIGEIFCDQNSTDVAKETKVVSQILLPEKDEWRNSVDTIISALDTDLTKVVPARSRVIEADGDIDAVSLAQTLFDYNHSTYNYLFEFEPGSAFVGASPECLFKRDGAQLYCEAVAGTSHGDNQNDLESSAKDQMEHKIVHSQLLDDLEKLCSDVSLEQECHLLQLRELTHLMSSFTGTLDKGVSDAQILSQLHPTAAVCGESREKAMDMIHRIESFDRGWYSGPVGWISKNGAEFAVAIRSALVNAKTISLYAGAGVVKGSDPELEWEETTRKMEQFINCLFRELE